MNAFWVWSKALLGHDLVDDLPADYTDLRGKAVTPWGRHGEARWAILTTGARWLEDAPLAIQSIKRFDPDPQGLIRRLSQPQDLDRRLCGLEHARAGIRPVDGNVEIGGCP